jgi:hypothetical protein
MVRLKGDKKWSERTGTGTGTEGLNGNISRTQNQDKQVWRVGNLRTAHPGLETTQTFQWYVSIYRMFAW